MLHLACAKPDFQPTLSRQTAPKCPAVEACPM
jgi:hypothetical protein